MTTTPNPASTGLLDSTALKARGIVSSRTTLHRYLHRTVDQNPFPRPMRQTETGRRYWREAEVIAWQEREAQRKLDCLINAPLVPDDDPAAWMPKAGRFRKDAAAATDPGQVATGASA